MAERKFKLTFWFLKIGIFERIFHRIFTKTSFTWNQQCQNILTNCTYPPCTPNSSYGVCVSPCARVRRGSNFYVMCEWRKNSRFYHFQSVQLFWTSNKTRVHLSTLLFKDKRIYQDLSCFESSIRCSGSSCIITGSQLEPQSSWVMLTILEKKFREFWSRWSGTKTLWIVFYFL